MKAPIPGMSTPSAADMVSVTKVAATEVPRVEPAAEPMVVPQPAWVLSGWTTCVAT